MALTSPGVQISVTDQSNYAPNALGSVAYILLATAQDKIAPGGTSIAAGTTSENAGKVWNISSQRDLVTTFGTPTFKTTSSGVASNADEQNEYGLLTAYSILGVSNTAYIQRANVDLAGLTGTTTRPLSNPDDGTLWMDTANTNWGIYEWSATSQAFTLKTPYTITSSSELVGNVTPNVTIGSIGDYAVNVVSDKNTVFYKTYDNTWQMVGNVGWQSKLPVITGTTTSPVIPASTYIIINTNNVNLASGANVAQVASAINSAAITGVSARVSSTNQLIISGTSAATSNGFVADGLINITNGNLTPLTTLGITSGYYKTPSVQISPYYSVPTWEGTIPGNIARPSGSVWQKASQIGSGLSVAVKTYSASTESWSSQTISNYGNVFAATYGLDPTGGGNNIAAGTIFAQYNVYETTDANIATYLWYRSGTGATVATGVTTTPVGAAIGSSFTLQTRANAASATVTTYSVSITSNTVPGFISAVSAASIPNVSAALNASGAMTLVHALGGDMFLTDGTGTPLANIGLTTSATNVYASPALGSSVRIATNWKPLTNIGYTVSATQPYVAPTNDTYWYYNNPSRPDIMISNGSAWVGYQTLTSDIRGYNLTNSNSTGAILSSSAPTKQDDGTQLEYGDLWLDTNDLENYPALYRWQNVSGVARWVLIDNSDNVSQNGIVFADARWGTSGSINPATDSIPSIATLAKSNYVDLDAPSAAFYARGTLLWNTRASGFNVKQFKSSYFTAAAYPNQSLPTVASTWVSASGYNESGVPNFGRKAQRGVVVAALKAAIDGSTALREDANLYNLIACPGYPELLPNMVALNEDRNNTAFIVGDTPMRLAATGTAIQNWAQNTSGSTSTTEDGLTTVSPYVGVYYPSGQTNDLSGASVVVPASHAALRTIIKSDNVSYPWMAPAGTRRGLIDNLSAIGYVDADSGSFVSIGVTQGLRDTLCANKINPLTQLPGTGLVVYGQNTLSSDPSAMDRINVARLINYLRTQLNILSRPFIFEPNDPITRNSIKSTTSSLLNDLIAKRGITDYLVVCDSTNNTTERIARHELWVDIAIQPTKDVEFIYIPIRLKNPGEIQGGNLASSSTVGTGA